MDIDKKKNEMKERDNAGKDKTSDDALLNEVTEGDYKYGFVTDIDTDIIPVGLEEDVVRLISRKKGEPQWMLDFRLKAFQH